MKAHPRSPGIWRTWIISSWALDPRFMRARFVLEAGPVLLVPASDLQSAIAPYVQAGRSWVPIRIDVSQTAINGTPVSLTLES